MTEGPLWLGLGVATTSRPPGRPPPAPHCCPRPTSAPQPAHRLRAGCLRKRHVHPASAGMWSEQAGGVVLRGPGWVVAFGAGGLGSGAGEGTGWVEEALADTLGLRGVREPEPLRAPGPIPRRAASLSKPALLPQEGTSPGVRDAVACTVCR